MEHGRWNAAVALLLLAVVAVGPGCGRSFLEVTGPPVSEIGALVGADIIEDVTQVTKADPEAARALELADRLNQIADDVINEDPEKIDWDDALDLCAQKIQRLRHDPKAILHIHGSGAKGVLKEATALLFNMLGSSRTWGSLCDAAGYMACLRDFGSRKNNPIADLLNAASIVNLTVLPMAFQLT